MDERPADEADPTVEDFAAADRLMAEGVVPIPSEPDARALQRRMLAEARTGDPRDFDLRFGLREPESRSERVRRDLFREGLGFEEYARRLKMHATRPVDEAMIRDCYEAKEGRAATYSEMLILAIDGRDDTPGSKQEYKSERAIDAAVSKLERRFPMFASELESVWTRAIDVRSADQSPPSLGGIVGDSMLEIATRAFRMAVSTWRESKSLAHKTRGVSRYERATAASLFCKRWFDGNQYPTAPELASGLRHEAARVLRDVKRQDAEDVRLAEVEAERRASAGAATTGAVSLQAVSVTITSQSVDLHAPLPARPPTKLADAVKIAERIVKAAGGKFPGRNALVDKIPASRDTVSAAIDRSPYLKARYAEYLLERKSAKEILLGGDAMSQFAADAKDEETLERLMADADDD